MRLEHRSTSGTRRQDLLTLWAPIMVATVGVLIGTIYRRGADGPRWTGQIPQFVDGAKPAISAAATETGEFYFVASSVRKSVWTFVRQLRGPHLSTWA